MGERRGREGGEGEDKGKKYCNTILSDIFNF